LTLGFYENFPINIHRIDNFTSVLSNKQLQQKLIQVFHEVNYREFTFEEVTNPTIPDGKVIFEFGLAESENFNFIDDKELEKALQFLSRERLRSMDIFCSIRYYKGNGKKRTPLKFDYYMIRTIFDKKTLEVQVFHERGPRYISPEEVTLFIYNKVNEVSEKNRKILKKIKI
jgi:hypothetical protein